jgi:hypothetical protein
MRVPEWTAEIFVDEQPARRLLRQFSQLTVDSLRLLAEGWNSTVWRVNDQ